MALKLKYTDEHGILHIDVSPTTSPKHDTKRNTDKTDLTDPKFDTINHRFAKYDLFGGKYDVEVASNCELVGEPRSLFRSRYNSVEEELANTPYAFATERSLLVRSANNNPIVDITIKREDPSPSRDIEDDRFFNRNYGLFGPSLDSKTSDEEEAPAFTITQLIHAQDRYFDLSSRQTVLGSDGKTVRGLTNTFEVRSVPNSASSRPETVSSRTGTVSSRTGTVSSRTGTVNSRTGTVSSRTGTVNSRTVTDSGVKGFKVVPATEGKTVRVKAPSECSSTVSSGKKKRESSFAIITELPPISRPSSPRSLPVDIRSGRVSPFRGQGFREETSRHNTPKTSAANSRAASPLRRRTNSLSRIDKMAQTAALPPPTLHLSRPHSPRNFLKENIEEVRGMSELNREKHEAEAEKKRIEEEETILKEMGLIDKKSDGAKSTACSRANSRSNSPSRLKLRSRSNSPSAVLCFENIPSDSKDFINPEDGMPKPAIRKSRGRALSKSQPQSSDVSPKHSKIPKRQSSVSPSSIENRRDFVNKRTIQNGTLSKSPRFISNSTSSIHETIRIGSQVHDKRAMSKSTQLLDVTSPLIKGKPPISPGRGGPPPSNKAINAKRLSPIVGTPNKSPTEDQKPGSVKTTPTRTGAKKPAPKPTTSITSRLTKQPKVSSRDPSPDKRRPVNKTLSTSAKVNGTGPTKTAAKVASAKPTPKPVVNNTKPSEPKKPISRTNSTRSLIRTPSTKTLNEKPPILKKRDSKTDLKSKSTTKINEVGSKTEAKQSAESKRDNTKKENQKKDLKSSDETKKKPDSSDVATQKPLLKQDSQTQYDKIINDQGELVIMTKKSVMSMTTAAITSQPLEVVTTVTNQLPAALEKAREKGLFERLNSKESIAPKDEVKKDEPKTEPKPDLKETKEIVEEKADDKKVTKEKKDKPTLFLEENVKLKPLQPPYNNPAVERVRQKIDSILKEPEVSPENILAATVKAREKEAKSTFKSLATKTKSDVKETKDAAAAKLTEIKNQDIKQNENAATEIRTEATKIIESIMTPIEEPKPAAVKPKLEQAKKEIEPIITVVNEKDNGPSTSDVTVKVNETLVKGEPEVEVQSSNLSTPGVEKMALHKKMADSNDSDKSDKSVSNGGFPQSTSTTPKPPVRAHRQKDQREDDKPTDQPDTEQYKQPNICQRLMDKCKSKCCPCCVKSDDEENQGTMGRLNCFKSRNMEAEEKVRDLERAAGKAATIEFENETRPKRSFRDVICCRNHRRVSDSSDVIARDVTSEAAGAVTETGCCGRKGRIERRDSILSDRPPTICCNNRFGNWLRGACRRRQSDHSTSRRPSMFSKNKSLSPTLPPEDTRKKLDPSLIEHTSVMRGAIPVLPIVLAYFCLVCNVLIPGLGTIFSGMFCLCFGIPRFGVHDGAKQRIGAFVINLLVGAGQLFTVLFCLVGWGWSIWWGVIMLKTARKYRKIKAEAVEEDPENVPPVTSNNHTRA